MPRKKQEKKLKIEDIKRNPDIEKKHFIHKFIEHEHEIMLCTTALFMLLICFVIYIGIITIDNKDKIAVYYDNGLKIKYNIDVSGVSDIVTLGRNNIVSNDEGEAAEFDFSITNDSLTAVKYKVYLEEDSSMVELDDCADKLVNTDAIRYSINDGKKHSLNIVEDDAFLIKSGYINSSLTKNYVLKIWIDKKLIEDPNKYHFHGRIVVVNDEE